MIDYYNASSKKAKKTFEKDFIDRCCKSRIKKKNDKDLSKSQVIDILKSMSSNELQEIICEVGSSESQEITYETSSYFCYPAEEGLDTLFLLLSM